MSSAQSGTWIPIALSSSVPQATTRSVILDGRELVVWRGSDGQAHVWVDRCPHRGMRLSFGFVRENSLNCLYHGWKYGSNAQCLRIPAHPDLSVPPSIRAQAIAQYEAGGLIWASLEAEPQALPALPEGKAISSTVIERPLDRVAEAIASMALPGESAEPAVIRTISPFAWIIEWREISVVIGLHPVTPGKTMTHMLLVAKELPQSQPSLLQHCLRSLRALRGQLESEAA